MRRLFSFNLLLTLLASFLAGNPSGVACTMHLADARRAVHDNRQHLAHHAASRHQRDSQDSKPTHGCNCPGECSSSGSPFTTTNLTLAPAFSVEAFVAHFAVIAAPPTHHTGLFPLSTGPPRSLRS